MPYNRLHTHFAPGRVRHTWFSPTLSAANVPEKIQIIGIGDDGLDGLTAQARRLIERAELLLGDEATLGLAPGLGAERAVIGTDLGRAVAQITAAGGRRIVLLASG